MKKLIYLFLFASFIVSCDTNDDDFYNSEYISIPNLVEIEVAPGGYAVGDYLLVKADIANIQNEPNLGLLDIRKTTNNADSFKFSYVLERKISATEWQVVDFSNNNTIGLFAGSVTAGSFITASAIYYSDSDMYKFEGGIPLEVAGEYRLSFGYNSISTTKVELRSNSADNNIFLNIFTTTNNLDSEGYYHFTVI